ncbi:MAG: SbmA/BacA-like family transporter, partial [Burkholderiaceae bacterium]
MPLFSRASAPAPVPHHPTNWRAVWRLIKPFWVSDQKWKGIGLLVAVVSLALGMVYLNVLFNEWNREFYNALEARNYDVFRHQLWRFSYLAFIYIAVAIYRTYLMQGLEILWRAWMTDRYMAGWLAHRAYYRIEQTRSTDNPDQRIAEDLSLLTTGTLTLGLGLLSSVVSLASFAGILWALSGPLSFAFAGSTWTVSGYMLWF